MNTADATVVYLFIGAAFFLLIGYFAAGKWYKGWSQVAMGILFAFLFFLAAIAIFVGGCVALVVFNR
jgi:hypothetical protein